MAIKKNISLEKIQKLLLKFLQLFLDILTFMSRQLIVVFMVSDYSQVGDLFYGFI